METVSPAQRAELRRLAAQYVELCHDERNLRAKALWSAHNALKDTRPPVYVDCWSASPCLKPELDAFLGPFTCGPLAWLEEWLKKRIWHASEVRDDSVYDPWLVMQSQRRSHKGVWGFDVPIRSIGGSQAFHTSPVITCMGDLEGLEATPHEVLDPEPPEVRLVQDTIGDILPIHVNRNTSYGLFRGTDLSEAAAYLLGYQELLVMLYEYPELVHALMAFMRDAVLANLAQCEAAGDCSTADGYNYTFLHCDDLPPPAPGVYGAHLKDLWCFMHAQEFEGVSPAMHKEFLLDYQMPIMERYGLVSYGCCESLDGKIDLLRSIKNLRSIAVGPLASLSRAAEGAGREYILSWRPNPLMVSHHYDPENCRRIVRQGLKDARGGHLHIMLKELMTVENDFSRVVDFSRIALEESRGA